MHGAVVQQTRIPHSSLQSSIFLSNEQYNKIHVENAVSGPDLQAINMGKREVGETMDAKINNVIYMELYSGPKMMDDEYLKLNTARTIDRDSTVYHICLVTPLSTENSHQHSLKMWQNSTV
jgi:hypothetical protein